MKMARSVMIGERKKQKPFGWKGVRPIWKLKNPRSQGISMSPPISPNTTKAQQLLLAAEKIPPPPLHGGLSPISRSHHCHHQHGFGGWGSGPPPSCNHHLRPPRDTSSDSRRRFKFRFLLCGSQAQPGGEAKKERWALQGMVGDQRRFAFAERKRWDPQRNELTMMTGWMCGGWTRRTAQR